MNWDVVVVLICNSLIIKDIEHLFMCFLVIYICSLEKYLFRFIAHFLKKLILFIFGCTGLSLVEANRGYSLVVVLRLLLRWLLLVEHRL